MKHSLLLRVKFSGKNSRHQSATKVGWEQSGIDVTTEPILTTLHVIYFMANTPVKRRLKCSLLFQS